MRGCIKALAAMASLMVAGAAMGNGLPDPRPPKPPVTKPNEPKVEPNARQQAAWVFGGLGVAAVTLGSGLYLSRRGRNR